MSRQFSPAWPRNRGPVRDALRRTFPQRGCLLEVASGPGQHAFDVAEALNATVQPTDADPRALASIEAWREQRRDPRVRPPALLDVSDETTWPDETFDGVVAVNFLHMVGSEVCERFFALAEGVLVPGGRVAVYDCFTYGGEHVSDSNRAFDARLRPRGGGVHAIEAMDTFASQHQLGEREVLHLPANNQWVSWRRGRSSP